MYNIWTKCAKVIDVGIIAVYLPGYKVIRISEIARILIDQGFCDGYMTKLYNKLITWDPFTNGD